MEYISIVNKAIAFIEDNLKEDLTAPIVGCEVGFSLYHFHRIFIGITGCSISEYIRKRRITEAAKEILQNKKTILDIALDYQFNSSENFTRAFIKQFGTNPLRFRQGGKSFHLLEARKLDKIKVEHLYEGMTINPRITAVDSFKTAGIMNRTQTSDIPMYFKQFRKKINVISHVIRPDITYGIVIPDLMAAEEDDINYLACVQVESYDELKPELYGYDIPSGNYAIFTHRNSIEKILETYRYIYGIWLPKSKHELIEDAPNIELYDERYYNPHPEVDIYIAIK
jgi:Uncharacterized protein conserved in bacteria